MVGFQAANCITLTKLDRRLSTTLCCQLFIIPTPYYESTFAKKHVILHRKVRKKEKRGVGTEKTERRKRWKKKNYTMRWKTKKNDTDKEK